MRSVLRYLYIVLLSISLLLIGCNSFSTQNDSSLAPDGSKRLVIYTSQQESIYEPLILEFEARTGIWVQIETGGTLTLLNRISQGDASCDLIFGGGVDTLEAYKDFFAVYQSPLYKEIQPEYVSTSGHWTPVSSLPIVFAYNSKLVRQNPPSGWADLLDPNWKGHIAYADPTISASAYTAMATFLQVYALTDMETILQQFLENLDGQLLSRSSSVIEQISNGNCYIGVTTEDEAIRSLQEGYDVDLVYPKEGTSTICDGVAILAGCAHEDNARLFVDFLLSKETQSYLSVHCYRRSVRTDLADNNEQVSGQFYDITWSSSHQEQILSQWNALAQEVTP